MKGYRSIRRLCGGLLLAGMAFTPGDAVADFGMGVAASVSVAFKDGLSLGWGLEARGSWSLNTVYCAGEGSRYGLGPSLQYAKGHDRGGRLVLAAQAGWEVEPFLLTSLSEVGVMVPMDTREPALHLGLKAQSTFAQVAVRGNPDLWTVGIGPELGSAAGYYGSFFCDTV